MNKYKTRVLHLNMEQYRIILRTLLLYLTTALIFYLLFKRVDIIQTVNSIKGINQIVLVQVVLISILMNVFISSDLRRRLLNVLSCRLTFKESLFLKMGSLPFKVIPTFKETGLVQAVYLKKYHGMPFSIGIFSTILANILSIISILLFFLFGFILYWSKLPEINVGRYIYIFAMIATTVLTLFFILLLNRNITRGIIFNLFRNKKSRAYKMIENIVSIWSRISLKNIIGLMLYNVVFQSSELIIFYILTKAYYFNMPFSAILLFVPLVILASNLPITVSGLGIREAVIILFFLRYGTKENLMGLGVLLSFVEHILPIMIGVFFLLPFVHRLKYK